MTPSLTLSLDPLVAQLEGMLLALREAFSSHVRALARHCSIDGMLDAARLDRSQVPSYELAVAGAELLAAETMLRELSETRTELAVRLALTYGAEACRSVEERLRRVAFDVDAPAAALTAAALTAAPLIAGRMPPLADTADVREFYRRVLSGAALEETGRLLTESRDELGAITLRDELSIAQGAFRRLSDDVLAPAARQIHREDLLVPDSILEQFRDMGVFGLSIPERYGGSAPDEREDTLMMIVVTEALSEGSLGAGGSLITRPEILSRALLSGGTAAQKEHWLPRIAAGDPLCAIAITEPDYGSDAASVQLKGTPTAGGWLLNGAKTWCTFAGKAGLIMVVTRTNGDRSLGHRGLSVLLVEKPAYDGHEFEFVQAGGGRLVGKAIATIGYRGMHSFDLTFENFFVPDANVIGESAGLGKGFYYTMNGMVGGRIQTAARACGVMRAALRAALRYAADRRVFNAPLVDYSLTRARLAHMAARYVACRQLTYAVGRLIDAGGGRMEASLVKLFACRSAEWLTRDALQIHGGMGYAEETCVSRYFVDARVLSIFEGAEETLALKVIARTFLEDALKSAAAGATDSSRDLAPPAGKLHA
jgi:(2S)-methylsuccinyl-CoA dehydrogenase